MEIDLAVYTELISITQNKEYLADDNKNYLITQEPTHKV